MSGRRTVVRCSRTVRMLIAVTALSACLAGAVAYAATRPERHAAVASADRRTGGGGVTGGRRRRTRAPRPRFVEVPGPPSVGAGAQFRFHVVPRAERSALRPPRPGSGSGGEPAASRRFQCRLDADAWEACGSPHLVDDLAPGWHSFAVRALSAAGRPGPAAHFAWEQLKPKPFSVEPRAGAIDDLYPGDPAQELPVLITNQNPVPIVVTSLRVAVGATPPDCPAAPNFAATPASVSAAAPLIVPAGASVSLPSAAVSAPAIALRDLPVNQNACQDIEVPLVFSGEAHG
jgi:hypothetical protein